MVTSNASHVPVLPAAHAQAVSLLMSKDATIAEIATIIESDPAMTLGVLRLANSAASSPAERTSRVGDAMVRIGLEDTRRIVLGLVVQDATSAELQESGLDAGELWRHVIATALLCDGVTATDEALKSLRPLAFSAGLLHDIGRLALASAAPAKYRRVLRRVETGVNAIEAELAEFGIDHATFGGEVAAEWGLLPEVTTAISSHHDPVDGLSAAIQRATAVAEKLGIGDGLVPAGEPSLDASDHDSLVVMHMGGTQQLLARIEWFRGALPR